MEAPEKSQCSHPRSWTHQCKPRDIHQVPSCSHVLIPAAEGPSNPRAKHQEDRKEAPRHTMTTKRQIEAREEPRLGVCDGVYRWRSFAHSKEGAVLCWCFLTIQPNLLSTGESLSTIAHFLASFPSKVKAPNLWKRQCGTCAPTWDSYPKTFSQTNLGKEHCGSTSPAGGGQAALPGYTPGLKLIFI